MHKRTADCRRCCTATHSLETYQIARCYGLLLALAALWIAEERGPNNPQVRFDLASLLVWHGSVNEADALLDAIVAGGRCRRSRSAMS